jgi:hypothetical protein
MVTVTPTVRLQPPLGEDETAVASHLEAAKAWLLIGLSGKARAPGSGPFEVDMPFETDTDDS